MPECYRLVAVAVLLAIANVTYAQDPDSTVIDLTGRSSHSPTGALWRSALVPGLGQLYNHQPLKTPIIVAALAGLTVLAVHNDNQFDLYNRAYLYGAYLNEDPHPFPNYEGDYQRFPGVSTSALRSRRDGFRRNRDMTIIGIILAYGLNVLDAYVNGHLYDFDVDEDLTGLYGGTPPPLRMSVRVRF